MEREDEKVSTNMRTKRVVFAGGTALLAATLLAVGAFMADKAHEDAFITMLYPPT
jgi:hypothetical protein